MGGMTWSCKLIWYRARVRWRWKKGAGACCTLAGWRCVANGKTQEMESLRSSKRLLDMNGYARFACLLCLPADGVEEGEVVESVIIVTETHELESELSFWRSTQCACDLRESSERVHNFPQAALFSLCFFALSVLCTAAGLSSVIGTHQATSTVQATCQKKTMHATVGYTLHRSTPPLSERLGAGAAHAPAHIRCERPVQPRCLPLL